MATTALVSELSFAPSVHGMAAALLFLLLTTVAAEATGARSHVHDTAQTTIARVNKVQAVSSFQTSSGLLCLSTQVIQPPPSHEPPARVLISTPTHNGSYPVVLFKHGFLIPNCFYTQLFESLASSGYIIVAPQTFTLDRNCTKEIDETAEVANWISESLAVVLDAAIPSANVTPNILQLVMAGHSKGGKIAFAMALGKASIEIIPSFSALVALDPVDCVLCKVRTYPDLVDAGGNHTRNNMSVPVLILGAGYGSKKDLCHWKACAPACCDHQAFFNCASASTIYHLVAAQYGHLDFLDDGLAWLTDLACIGGSPKADLRDFSTELIVAFLESALEGKQASIESIVENWKSAPVTLEEPEVYREGKERARVQKRESAYVKLSKKKQHCSPNGRTRPTGLSQY